jgi:beta-aspartyl-peptidase (threonine type)
MNAKFEGFSVLLLAGILALGTVNAARSQDPPQPAKDSEAITAVISAQQAAWNHGDIPTFLEEYWRSPELTFSGTNGIVRGYEGVLERYQKTYPDKQAMGELQFSSLEIRMLGADSAMVLGHWQLTRKLGDVGGVFTLIFQRFPVGWRIIHDHTSAQKLTP